MRRVLLASGGLLLAAALALPALAAPAKGAKKEAPKAAAKAPKISEAAQKEAKEIFSSRCTACHGAQGLGDGVAAAALNPKPRNFHDQAWQKSVTDEHIEKIIKAGGAAVGKSPLMPANPDLDTPAKAEVVTALREIVRGFGK